MELKDFYYKLQIILNDYYDMDIDIDDATLQIEALKIEAVSNGLEVNLSNSILEVITPFSSYDDENDNEDSVSDNEDSSSY